MKFLLLMNVPVGTGNYESSSWKPEDIKAQMNFLNSFNKDLKEAGEYVGIQALTPPGKAKLVQARDNDTPITDGPFAETKEFLAGFWIVDVENEARAIELAVKASAQPGPGGRPMNIEIEVRQAMSGPS